MDENPYETPNEAGRACKPIKKRMPGYRPFEFFRLGWFIVGVVFLPVVLLLTWAVTGLF